LKIAPDHRLIECHDRAESLAVLEREAGVRLEADLLLARALVDLVRQKTPAYFGCGSVEQLARRYRLSERDAKRLLLVGRALEVEPSLEERIRRGAISIDAAATIAPALMHEALSDEREFWMDEAEVRSPYALNRRVKRRFAEIRCGEEIVDVTVHVPETVREGFERAREIASEKAGRPLDPSQTFEALVDHYLDSFDILRKQNGMRRVGPTGDLPGDRYIPISVRRAVRRRAGDACEFPGCWHRRDLQFAHWDAHRDGSGREENDLLLLCWWHHTLYDGKKYARVGSPADPVFIDSGLGGRRGEPQAYTRRQPSGRPLETEAERRAYEEWKRAAERGKALVESG